jgi:hypothetical protein
MPRLTYRRAEWEAIAAELAAPQRVVPPGLIARVQALLQQIPDAWPDQSATLELDASSADAVQAIHGALVARDPAAGARADAVAEAVAIIQTHQRRAD